MVVLFDIGSKSIETSCSSSSAALEGEQSKDTNQNRNLSIVLVLEKVCHDYSAVQDCVCIVQTSCLQDLSISNDLMNFFCQSSWRVKR